MSKGESQKSNTKKESLEQHSMSRQVDIESMKVKGTFVNGPINVVRLEGRVDNVKKVVYIFLLYDLQIRRQTKCKSIYSKSIRNYLAKGFSSFGEKTDRKLDVFSTISTTYMKQFVESGSTSEPGFSPNFTMNYIVSIRKLLSRIYYNQNSAPFPNIRIHGAEILDHLNARLNYRTVFQTLFLLRSLEANNLWPMYPGDKEYFVSGLTNDASSLNMLRTSYLRAINNELDSVSDDEKKLDGTPDDKQKLDMSVAAKSFHKMLKRVNSTPVKELTHRLLSEAFEKEREAQEFYKEIIQFIEKMEVYLQKPRYLTEPATMIGPILESPQVETLKLLLECKITCSKLFYCLDFIVTNTTLAYFLRRVLDKTYITHSVLFIPYSYSIVSVDILVKQFGFEVTHTSYRKTDSIEELNSKIRESQSVEEVASLLLFTGMPQCSNLDGFPKNFE